MAEVVSMGSDDHCLCSGSGIIPITLTKIPSSVVVFHWSDANRSVRVACDDEAWFRRS